MKVIAQISRLLVGALFIFSGFIKANDPLGFSYKLDEYFQVFGMPWLTGISLALAIGICAFEIGLGVALLLGAKMNFTAWSLLLMIVFFTFLTFWSWKFDVVKDCGCFGDFMHLEPFQSFMKDVVLLVLILFIFIKRHEIGPLFGGRFSTVLAYLGFLVSFLFSLHCYYHLPVIDFRPYAVGKSIPEGMKLPPGAKTDSVAMVWIYNKDGKEIELTIDQLGELSYDSTNQDTTVVSTLDSNYTWEYNKGIYSKSGIYSSSGKDGVTKFLKLDVYKYVNRIDKKIREGDKAPIHDFTISDVNGTDHTEDILSMDHVFLLVAYDINASNKAVQGKINDFVNLCQRDGIEFIGMTSSLKDDVAKFTSTNGSKFDYYFTDGTTLKTMIRSNPGLILLSKGTVKAMWHWYDFPSYDDIKKSGLLK